MRKLTFMGAGLRRVGRDLHRFGEDRRGVVAIFVAIFSVLILGMGVLSIDVGRVTILRTQMQNAADAAAIGAAAQLDGFSGARDRATAVGTSAAQQTSTLKIGGGSLTVQSIIFYSSWSPQTAATSDSDAAVASVTMTPVSITLLLQPLLTIMTGDAGSDTTQVTATAAAQYSPVICNAPPLMVCNPAETAGSSADLAEAANAGKQIVVKEGPGGNAGAPGQFGTLCTAAGACGASAIGTALAAVTQSQCNGPTVETAPGSKTQQIRNGFNSRFDEAPGTNYPARNIIPYTRDSVHVSGSGSTFMGDGNWGVASYWASAHPAVALPSELSNASRYQVYLYELGETYAANGKQTLYPVPASLPSGYSLVAPSSANIPAGGTPSSTPEADAKRRVIKVAVLDCAALGVAGHGTYPVSRYVDVFLTESVPGPPNANAYGEIVGGVTASTSSDFHANVVLLP